MIDRRPLLIGLAGQARTGKDTAGAYLATRYRLASLAFAAPIKRAIAAMLDVPYSVLAAWPKDAFIDGLGITPRHLFQTLGTDWGRDMIHRDLWVWLLRRQWREIMVNPDFGGAVITDIRMGNEADFVRGQGGLIIHISRQNKPAVRQHVSEQALSVFAGDVVVQNDGTLDELYCRLNDVVQQHITGSRHAIGQ